MVDVHYSADGARGPVIQKNPQITQMTQMS